MRVSSHNGCLYHVKTDRKTLITLFLEYLNLESKHGPLYTKK